jgi:hypothetical protein
MGDEKPAGGDQATPDQAERDRREKRDQEPKRDRG